jgi:hypothetical protein
MEESLRENIDEKSNGLQVKNSSKEVKEKEPYVH